MEQRPRYEEQMNRFLPLINATLRGVRQNTLLKGKYAKELRLAYKARKKVLYYMLDQEVNIKSPKQMCTLFYADFGLKEIRKKKKKGQKQGSLTADVDALSLIAKREPLMQPICALIEEMRSIGVFLSTFVLARLDSDDRIRCAYKQAGTSTFRFASSKNPMDTGANLQNIPKGNEDD